MDNHIWEWMREGVFDPESVKFFGQVDQGIKKWSRFDQTFTKQINWRFQRTVLTRDERDEQLGRGLRSSVEDELLIDDDGANANTTNIKRTSRYHIEDILRMREKRRITLFCFFDTIKLGSETTTLVYLLMPENSRTWLVPLVV